MYWYHLKAIDFLHTYSTSTTISTPWIMDSKTPPRSSVPRKVVAEANLSRDISANNSSPRAVAFSLEYQLKALPWREILLSLIRCLQESQASRRKEDHTLSSLLKLPVDSLRLFCHFRRNSCIDFYSSREPNPPCLRWLTQVAKAGLAPFESLTQCRSPS